LEYQARNLFRKISGKTDTPKELYTVIDDVTSHASQSITKKYNGKDLKITMVHNPSHLEAQNPVSMGKTKSKQHFHGFDKVLNIQVHGDSAICGQGIVYESFVLGKVPKYDVGGTIHIITNNQLGYTTRPIDSRGSKYCSDVAKAFDTPVIHCNS
jgi:probable 2-oxoglutarate dehydrogenase E1 component DHKTD1